MFLIKQNLLIFLTFFVICSSFEVKSSFDCGFWEWFKLILTSQNDCVDFTLSKKQFHSTTTTISCKLMKFICDCQETGIEIEGGQLTIVEENSFKPCPSLKRISFYRNNIRSIPGGAFRGLYALETLELGGNMLIIINEEWFVDLRELKELHLQKNQIKLVPAYILHNLRNLKTLILSENHITNITIDRIEQLDELYVANNRFTCSEIDKLKSKLGPKIQTDMTDYSRLNCSNSNIPTTMEATQTPRNSNSTKEEERKGNNVSSCKVDCSITLLAIASVITGVNGVILILFVFKLKITEITFST